jgi:HTH-type transcriptional regulator/antitoxin MqsA
MNPTEECHVCGGDVRLAREPMEIQIGQRATKVAAERMRCDSCQTEFFLPGQMEAAQKLAAEQMRAEEGLLSPAEVRAIRDQYGLSQADLEKMLGVGPKTVVRWERGTVFQNKSTDALLRVLRDVPAAAEYLANRGGVQPVNALRGATADAAPSWGAQFDLDIVASAPQRDEGEEPTPAIDDPKVVSLDSYKAKRPLERIPQSLIGRAQL